MSHLDYYSLSFVGRRKNNQDSCVVLKPSRKSMFLAVADGMGGAAGGEVASKSVMASAQRTLKEKFKCEVRPEHLKDILIKIFSLAQTDILNKIKSDPDLTGMGTTLSCVLILDDKFVFGSIGDSRIYRYTDSELIQISIDHTFIQEYIDNVGRDIPKKIIENHGHFLTRAINGGDCDPDIFPRTTQYESLKDGEAFLLCSDGMILDKTNGNSANFKDYLLGAKNLKDTAENLVSNAYTNGSDDNISIVLCSIGELKKQKIELKINDYPPCVNKTKNTSILKNWFFKKL